MCMIETSFKFLMTSREGNLEFHLAALSSMLPWFFYYDRINYVGYTLMYMLEVTNIDETHPDVHEGKQKGGFITQHQGRYGLSHAPVHQANEQTINHVPK